MSRPLIRKAGGFAVVSIRVASLDAARAAVTRKAQGVSEDYAGPYGRSLLVPAARAGGTWLEFFE